MLLGWCVSHFVMIKRTIYIVETWHEMTYFGTICYLCETIYFQNYNNEPGCMLLSCARFCYNAMWNKVLARLSISLSPGRGWLSDYPANTWHWFKVFPTLNRCFMGKRTGVQNSIFFAFPSALDLLPSNKYPLIRHVGTCIIIECFSSKHCYILCMF